MKTQMFMSLNKINIGIDHILIFNESIARIKFSSKKKSLIARFATTSKFKNLEKGKVRISPAMIFLCSSKLTIYNYFKL